MKKFFYLFVCMLFTLVACDDDDDNITPTFPVSVQVTYADGADMELWEGLDVTLTSATGVAYSAETDSVGKATFIVPVGVYEAVVTSSMSVEGYLYHFNGIKSGITVTETWVPDMVTPIEMVTSRSGQVIIKELYNGGCLKDDGSSLYQFDKYVILYNNSGKQASLSNFCLGMINPYNGEAASNDYVNGELYYKDKGWIPAGCAIHSLDIDMVLEPYQSILIPFFAAIDHTLTYSNSVDLSHADYVCYDLDVFDNASYYSTPSESIPTSHYFKAHKYGMGNAWPLSVLSPAFFIFQTHDVTPAEFASDPSLNYYTQTKEGKDAFLCKQLPRDWVLDAIEVFNSSKIVSSHKRLTPDLDGGYVQLTNKMGHTLYRNVDKKATEALEENQGKLVYNYDKGFEGSTDPSGIDAEASIKNGAHIIYQDTNNSSKDFHERKQSTLKD